MNYVNYMSSLIYPFIDTYWATLTFVLKFILGKMSSVNQDQFRKRVQWFTETLCDDGYIKFAESCSMDIIKTSIYAFKMMGVLSKRKIVTKKGRKQVKETVYSITDEYLQDGKLHELHQKLELFRSKSSMKLTHYDN